MPGPRILIAIEGVTCSPALARHLRRLAPQARHAIAFSSHQPAGTRGAAMLAGASRIKIQGEWIPVQAEVQALDGLSSHADRQGLLDWILALPRPPRQLYLMGEPEASDSLRQAIAERRPWPCSVPEYMELAHLGEADASQRGWENSSKAATALAAYISDGPPPM
jgi:metallo-beta-lactamase family protein